MVERCAAAWPLTFDNLWWPESRQIDDCVCTSVFALWKVESSNKVKLTKYSHDLCFYSINVTAVTDGVALECGRLSQPSWLLVHINIVILTFTYLLTYLLTYLFTYLLTCLPNSTSEWPLCSHTVWDGCRCLYLLTYLLTYRRDE